MSLNKFLIFDFSISGVCLPALILFQKSRLANAACTAQGISRKGMSVKKSLQPVIA